MKMQRFAMAFVLVMMLLVAMVALVSADGGVQPEMVEPSAILTEAQFEAEMKAKNGSESADYGILLFPEIQWFTYHYVPDSWQLHLKLKNTGKAQTGQFYVRISGPGLASVYYKFNNLLAGQEGIWTHQFNAPVHVGGCKLRVDADYYKQVTELNENNNTQYACAW